ncbi:MAG: SDR family NAD(P)-dependent oxidoreductase [Spirochaetaceae bacterium]|nr:SDR family NAD(P)-dependent oxidoreductase [Spirochaetaceae bacterium]HPG25482.1 SDR family NAD(P)-dependent oxidoreductase [Myxococcota bacterium]
MGFEGKVAVVTGAASGIGLGLGEALARAGARVVLADVEAGALARAAKRVEAAGGEVLAVVTDVGSRDSVGALAERTLERFGRVDLLFNNAGVSTFNPIANQTLADWEWVLRVNLWGVIHGLDVFLPIFRRQGGPAHIVNTSSIAGVISGLPCIGPYAVSKVGVVSISETLRIELAQEGSPIRVSVLLPENTNTGVMDSERNRPGERETRSEAGELFRTTVKAAFTQPGALEPDEVARRTLEAMEAGRFWIFSHHTMGELLEARLDEIRDAYRG